MTGPTSSLRVWIGCLASYNAGRLIGEWCDATDLDVMHECRDRVAKLAKEAACREWPSAADYGSGWLSEEFFIADYDGFPSGLADKLGEYPNWEELAELAEAIESAAYEDEDGFAAWLMFASDCGIDIDADTVRDWAEFIAGVAESEAEFAAQWHEDCGTDLGGLASFIDWEAVARDQFFQHGTYYLVDGYVFDSEAR